MSVTTPFTITYSESSQGFPSFYSYIPDFIIGMNQYLYTFKGGNLFRHNTNETRNQFYGEVYQSQITSIFNEAPLQNKIFKTINLEGDDAWKATIISDLQTTGLIEASYFEKKEAAWFAFVRNNGPTGANTVESEWELRSLNGIASSSSVAGVGVSVQVNFATSVNIGSIISVGDNLYYATPSTPPATSTPVFAGAVTQINVDLPNGLNQIVVDTTVVGATPPPNQTDYFLFIKNPIAESHGILGHFAEFTLQLPILVTSGTNTAVLANNLVDTTAGTDFIADGVLVGDVVKNTTTSTHANITVVAATQLTLDADIFAATPQNYEVLSSRKSELFAVESEIMKSFP